MERTRRQPGFANSASPAWRRGAFVLVFVAGLSGTPDRIRAEGSPEPATAAPVERLLADDAELIDWLAAHDPQVAAARARSVQAEAQVAQSGVLQNPSLGMSLSNLAVGRTTPPGLGYNDMAIYSVQLSETVELGKRGPRVASAQRRQDAAGELLIDALAARAADARQVLGRLVHVQARQAVLDQTLKGARDVLLLERSRLEHGDISGNDLDRLQLDTLGLESDVAQNRAEVQAALADCQAVLQAPCSGISLPDSALTSAAALPDHVDALDGTLAERPDLRALTMQADSAAQDAVLAGRRAIPDPTFGVGFTRDQFTVSGDNANAFMVSVSLPLPVFDRGQHDAGQAEARRVELEQVRRATLLQARADVDGLSRRLDALQATLDVLTGLAVPKSRQVLDRTLDAFHRGQVSLTDLLLVRRQHTELLLKAMDTRFEAFGVRNDLRRALGLDAQVARTRTSSTPLAEK